MCLWPIPTAFPVYLTGRDSKALSGAGALADIPVHLFDTLTQCLGKQMVLALRTLHHSYCNLPALNRTPGMFTSLQQSPLPRTLLPLHTSPHMVLNIYLDQVL